MLKRIPHHQLFKCGIDGLVSGKLRCYASRVRDGYNNITCPITAEKAVDCIRTNQRYKDGIFIECKAGPGILTNALLPTRSPSEKYICCESREKFHANLKNLESMENVCVVGWNPLSVFVTKKDLKELLSKKKLLSKELLSDELFEDSTLTIFGIVNPSLEFKILQNLVLGLTIKNNIFSMKQLELFLFCSPTVYREILNARSDKRQGILYKRHGLLFDLLFDAKAVLKLSASDFTPVFVQKPKFRETVFDEDTVKNEEVYLLRMRPKPEFVSQFTTEELYDFMTFIQIILRSGKSRIIPLMENWLHGSGLYLISMGFTMLDKVMLINPEAYLRIFKSMKHWPMYDDSIMKQMLTEKAFHLREWSGHEESLSTLSSQRNIPSGTADQQQIEQTGHEESLSTLSSQKNIPSGTADQQQTDQTVDSIQ